MKNPFLLMAACVAAGAAQAAIVVNVPGADGGAGTVQSVSYPVAVGTVLAFDRPVLLDLAAGDYLLTPTVASLTAGASFEGWNFQVPEPGSWGNHFVAGADLGSGLFSVLVDGQTLSDPSCRNHFCAWDTEAQAVAAWLATPAFRLHLDRATTVGFVAADYFLPDNAGGISFTISAVPEPAPALMLAAGLGALAIGRRRRAPDRGATGR